jgi:hypothetical protein
MSSTSASMKEENQRENVLSSDEVGEDEDLPATTISVYANHTIIHPINNDTTTTNPQMSPP